MTKRTKTYSLDDVTVELLELLPKMDTDPKQTKSGIIDKLVMKEANRLSRKKNHAIVYTALRRIRNKY